MSNQFQKILIAAAVSACGAQAQEWEFGVAGGYGFYKSAEVSTGSGRVSAGVKSGAAFGVVGTQNFRYLSGEARYTYRFGDLKLENGGTATLGAESHAVHYDLLVNGRPRGAAVRPYAAIGAGIKYFRGRGKEPIVQPLSQYALLTRTDEVKPLISFGAGVKFAISRNVLVRVDVRDYATPVPTNLIAPRRGATVHGWLHDIVPMVGIGFQF
jgi:hypothetical protein